MTPFFSFLKNFVFQKTKKWCHARKDDDRIIDYDTFFWKKKSIVNNKEKFPRVNYN
ncbi:hypothetical protein L6261_01075 [Candidatus Parcubacteria bacterium]|nr:hypothetical protein [Candidatus Parcubacteria bacterium]